MTLILLTSIIYFYTHDFLYTQVIIMYSSQKANLQINKSKYNNRGKLKYKKLWNSKEKYKVLYINIYTYIFFKCIHSCACTYIYIYIYT